jgi:hypothetical protein
MLEFRRHLNLKTLVDSFRKLRNATNSIVLGTSILAVPQGSSALQLPVNPLVASEKELVLSSKSISKYSAKFLLKSAVLGIQQFAQHRSHSSHSSHRSHSSHYSGASTPAPRVVSPRVVSPPPPPPATVRPPAPSPTPGSSPVPRNEPDSSKTPVTPNSTAAPLLSSGKVTDWTETFTAVVPDRNRWKVGTLTTGPAAPQELVRVIQKNRRLEITRENAGSGRHYNGYISATPLNAVASIAAVEVVSTMAEESETIFGLAKDADNWYRFAATRDSISFEISLAGKKSAGSETFEPDKHRFWRFRHDPASNILYWETSADSESWTVNYAKSVSVPLASVHIELSAGSLIPAAPEEASAFDNVRFVSSR